MASLGIWMAAVGLADLVVDPSRRSEVRFGAFIGAAVAGGLAVVTGISGGLPLQPSLLLGAIAAASSALWLWSRASQELTRDRAAAVLAMAGVVTLTMAASAGAWPALQGGWLEDVVADQPFETIAAQPLDRSLLIAGVLTFLQASGNAVIRLVLALAGTRPAAEQRLRGGRFIGPMERTLIFGLGLAGHLTAAAVVATAKGLLRFPEMNREGQSIHEATEYFLVGSLASWTLALAPLALL